MSGASAGGVPDPARGLPAAGYPIDFARHAVERWMERARPGITPHASYLELRHLLATARVVTARPEWLPSAEGAAAWLLLGDDFAAPLRLERGELLACTVMCRGSLPAATRERRNHGRANRRAGRRAARKAERHRPPLTRPQGPTAEEFA